MLDVSRRRAARDRSRRSRAAAATAAAAGARRGDAGRRRAPQVVDITLFLDDYKPVDGVLLPHHMSRSIDGKPTEEMTFKTIKINPAFKPDTFAAQVGQVKAAWGR